MVPGSTLKILAVTYVVSVVMDKLYYGYGKQVSAVAEGAWGSWRVLAPCILDSCCLHTAPNNQMMAHSLYQLEVDVCTNTGTCR